MRSLQRLAAVAAAAGATLAVVSGSADVREQLRGAGLPAVYESLDAALAVVEPVLIEAGAPVSEPPLHTAAADAFLP
jgi:hypothetical protein